MMPYLTAINMKSIDEAHKRVIDENDRLRRELDACCGKYKNDIEKLHHAIGHTPLEKSGGFIEGVCEQIKKLQYDLFAAKQELDRLRKALENLRIKEHDEFDEDCWYACPKSGKCCDESADKNKCTCGMDRINEIIDNALRGEK